MTAACPACVAAPAALELAQSKAAVQLSVPSIRCAMCIAAIEDCLNKIPRVEEARVNLTQKRVNIKTALPVEALTSALGKIGYEAYPLDTASLAQETDRTGRDLLLRLGVAGFAMMNVMLLSVAVWSGADGATRDLFHLISSAIALPVVLFSAQPFFRHAMTALRAGRLNMDVPISLAILLAAGMSLYESLNGGAHAYFDAALSLTFFLLIGRYLEHHTRSAARSAAKELSALEVRTAERKTRQGYQSVACEELRAGDTVLVKTGMRVPADGTLCAETAMTDRSFLTGESDPVMHGGGSALNAGEINLGAPFELNVTAAGSDTRLRQISALVETAENARNSYTSLADRAAAVYAPAVHLLAAVAFLGWYFATGDLRHSLNIAIAVLIITCPCALGLAVPAVSTAAIARLYKLGFLVKSGTALERLAEVDTVVFDKTGTLTKPGVDLNLSAFSDQERAVAKALAQASSHPLSVALNHALGDQIPAEITDINEVPGAGIEARFDGTKVALGSASWLDAASDGLCLKFGERTRLLSYSEAEIDGAEGAVSKLQAGGYDVHLISGDTAAKTKALAARLNVNAWQAGVSPEEKQGLIQNLLKRQKTPCMVGDGLNDTIALSQAHASVAPGSALDAARNSADVVMLGDTLKHLPKVFAVSKFAVRLSRQNFTIATVYNAIAIPIALAGFATPLLAALAMSASSITVLINSARLNWVKE